MNLITQIIENIYKNGNSTLYRTREIKDGKFKYAEKVIFYANDNGKLNIKVKRYFYDKIEKFDVKKDDYLNYVALLVYYTYYNIAQKDDLVCLKSDETKINKQTKLLVLNELYREIIRVISIEKHHIESLVKTTCQDFKTKYNVLVNSSSQIKNEDNNEILTYEEIMVSTKEKFFKFEEVLMIASERWKKAVNDESEDFDISNILEIYKENTKVK